jgi:hypothetical protein
MGCGASSLNEDGSIKAGTVLTKFESDLTTPVFVYYTFTAKDTSLPVTCCRKAIQLPTGLSDAKETVEKNLDAEYTTDGVVANGDNTFWLETKPGAFMQAYTVGGNNVPSPLGLGCDIPHKLYGLHQGNPENLPKALKKLVEDKKEAHPYNCVDKGANGVEKGVQAALDDLEACKPLRTAKELPANFDKAKEILVKVERNIPMNMCITAIVGAPHLGTWDGTKEKPDEVAKQMGLLEKGELKVKSKLSATATGFSVRNKIDSIVRDFTMKACDKACEALKTTKDVFLPTVEPAVDGSIEARNGNDQLKEFPKELVSELTVEEITEAEDKTIASQWAFDKPRLAAWQAADAKSIGDRKKAWKATVDGLVDAMRAPSGYMPKNGEVCVINFWGKGYFEGTFLGEKKLEDGTTAYEVEFPSTKLLEKKTGTIAKTLTVKQPTGVYGEFKEVEIPTFLPLPPPVSVELVYPSLSVRVRRDIEATKSFYFCTAVVEGLSAGEGGAVAVAVRDRYGELFSVPQTNVWLSTSVEAAAARAWCVPQNYYSYSFWWVCEEQPDDAVRKLQIWREGAKAETLQVVAMEKTREKAKPVKNAEGALVESPYQVFKGYKADVKLLPNRVYCYSYVIGDEVFLTEKDKAINKDGYKRFSLKLA